MALLTAATPEPKRRWFLMTALKPGLHFIGTSLAGGGCLGPEEPQREDGEGVVAKQFLDFCFTLVQLLKSTDLGRHSLLYLKEIGHGWFGKVSTPQGGGNGKVLLATPGDPLGRGSF